MLKLQGLGSNTPSGVPYTEEEINALARKGKQRGHLPGVGRVLPGRTTYILSPPLPQYTHNSVDVKKLKKKNKHLTKHVNLMMKLFRIDDKFSLMLNQYESSPEFDNASGSGGCGDDEMADDEDGGKDEEDEEDDDSYRCYLWVVLKNADVSRATCRPRKLTLKNGKAIPGDMSPEKT
nr:hypothetical protein [Tanacetum cinerariifolium]